VEHRDPPDYGRVRTINEFFLFSARLGCDGQRCTVVRWALHSTPANPPLATLPDSDRVLRARQACAVLPVAWSVPPDRTLRTMRRTCVRDSRRTIADSDSARQSSIRVSPPRFSIPHSKVSGLRRFVLLSLTETRALASVRMRLTSNRRRTIPRPAGDRSVGSCAPFRQPPKRKSIRGGAAAKQNGPQNSPARD